MNNKDLLNEGLFKKKTYADKLAKKYPQYAPVDAKNTSNLGFTAVGAEDTAELKKRLTGALGVAIGNNTIKNMASKSIKRFPIIISDNVDPQTAVLLKNYLEVQYAEYLNLLISNQVIDLTQYDRNDPDGNNIATQALDQITGTEFGRQRVANKAMRGSLNPDDVFANNPIYSLIRQESVHTGNSDVDYLLEDAIVIDSKKADELTSLLVEATEARVEPQEQNKDADKAIIDEFRKAIKKWKKAHPDAKPDPAMEYKIKAVEKYDKEQQEKKNKKKEDQGPLSLYKAIKDDDKFLYVDDVTSTNANGTVTRGVNIRPQSSAITKLVGSDRALDKEFRDDLKKRGYVGLDANGYEKYNRLTNTDVVVDPTLLNSAINKTIGEIMIDPKNEFLKNRFEKATFLLESRIIAGTEYFAYVTQRLGIPVRNEVRRDLITKFPAKNLSDPSIISASKDGQISKETASMISRNEREVYKISNKILSARAADVLKYSAIGGGIGLGAGAAGAGLGMAAGLTIAGAAILWPLGIGLAAGGLAGTIAALIKHRRDKHGLERRVEKYNSWQRVEELIEDMDDRTFQLKVDAKVYDLRMSDQNVGAKAETEFELKYDRPKLDSENELVPMQLRVDSFIKNMSKLYESCSYETSTGMDLEAPISFCEEAREFNEELCNLVCDSLNETVESLNEKLQKVSMTKPVSITKLTYDDKSELLVPSFGTKNTVAYGSVEYDRREIKDRKFNTPLIMTVKFKERYSDGKYADNELTAVIGILGVITRVPTEEMEFILKANTEGTVVKGIFSGDEKGSLGDLFANFKANNDYSKTPISGEIWRNMEKINQLALANKLAGKTNNNIANAHIIFSQKEIDSVRQTTGVDYLRDRKAAASLMKRYSAMNLMVANDTLERAFVFDNIDAISWDVIPYDALRGKDSSDQLAAALNKLR